MSKNMKIFLEIMIVLGFDVSNNCFQWKSFVEPLDVRIAQVG